MKKFSVLLTLAVLMVSSSVFAGSIDYLSNQSAKYLMTLAGRAAATDGADIVSYNPAGTALMGEGFFIDVSNQTLLKPYSQDVEFDGASYDLAKDTYEQDTATYLLPNVYIAYNAGLIGMGKLAVFGQAGVVAGGGSLEWSDASAGLLQSAIAIGAQLGTMAAAYTSAVTSVNAKVKGSSVYYAFGGGVAYSFLDDMISISAGAKYVIAKRSGEVDGVANYYAPAAATAWSMDIKSKYEYDAAGYTPVFGIDIRPMKELTLGIKYEMETDLEFEYTQKDNTITNTLPAMFAGLNTTVASQLNKDGLKANQNLPQILAIAAEYVVTPELAVSTGAQLYFLGDADMEGYEDYYGTGYEVSIGATYKVIEPLKIGAAVMYTDQGAKDSLLESSSQLLTVSGNPVLNSIFFGLGATYTVIPNLDITLSGGWVHYLPEEADVVMSAGNTMKVEYSKEVYNIALGASYKI